MGTWNNILIYNTAILAIFLPLMGTWNLYGDGSREAPTPFLPLMGTWNLSFYASFYQARQLSTPNGNLKLAFAVRLQFLTNFFLPLMGTWNVYR